MSMFKKPYERTAKTTLNILIYGRPGVGKTTLACSAPGAFLMDFDRGIDRVNPLYQAQNIYEPERWEDLQLAVQELANTPEAQTIVIDTISKLLDMAVDYVRRTKPNLIQNDGTPNLKGYGYRNQLFKEFLASLNSVGKSVVFVAHEVEDKQKINREEVTTMRPNITGANRNEVVQDLDMMGYVMTINGQRTITFDQNDNILAKNSREIHGSWNMVTHTWDAIPIPMLDDKTPNTFLADRVFGGNAEYLKHRQEQMESYNDLVVMIKGNVEECNDAETLNALCQQYGSKSFGHVFNSRMVASASIAQRAKELNLKYNAKTKKYEEEI